MAEKQPESLASKVLFPIGGKLLLIISLLLLLSLSALTALVYVLVKQDIGNTAEQNNLRVNVHSAAEAENLFTRIRGQTITLLDIINRIDQDEQKDRAADLFFEQNREIAAILVNYSSLTPPSLFLNELFFLSHEIEASLVAAFLDANREKLGALVPEGEYKLVNGMPVFTIPVLALVYTRNKERVTVLFSSQTLTGNLGSGTNPSLIIDNDDKTVLVHADSDMVRDNAVLTPSTESWFSASTPIPGSNAVVITRIPDDVVFEGINTTTMRNIYLTITVLSLSILFIWFFSKTISRPLKELRAAAEQIETGDYKIEIKNTSRDETGVLSQSFLSMSHALENFERFTNRAVVNLARRGKLSLGGTSKNAVICFSLIRDFETISEKLNAQGLVKFINGYMRRMVPCITKTGGIVDKFLTQGGVVIMALWGTVDSEKSQAQNAIDCIKSVLLMRSALRKLNRELTGFPLIKMGCGINAGEVVSGQMGSEQRMEFTVIGDAVNLASRIEGPNDLFDTDILITENVYNLVGRFLITEEMPSLKVKGKEKPLRVFTVLNARNIEGPKTLEEVREQWKK